MSDIPSLADEIERKTITELQRVMHGLQTRRIGIVAAAASLQTLWEVSAGLVSTETMDLVGKSATAVQGALNSKPRPEECVVLIGGGQVAQVQRFPDRIAIQMGAAEKDSTHNWRVIKPEDTEAAPEAWLAHRFASVCDSLNDTMCRMP